MTRRVDFHSNVADLRSLILASLGFSTFYIKKQTKLSPGQIQYRLKKGVVKRTDYRNGTSATAQIILQDSEAKIVEQVKRHIQKQELKERRAFAKKKKPSKVA